MFELWKKSLIAIDILIKTLAYINILILSIHIGFQVFGCILALDIYRDASKPENVPRFGRNDSDLVNHSIISHKINCIIF